jgi:hypothetical protein
MSLWKVHVFTSVRCIPVKVGTYGSLCTWKKLFMYLVKVCTFGRYVPVEGSSQWTAEGIYPWKVRTVEGTVCT